MPLRSLLALVVAVASLSVAIACKEGAGTVVSTETPTLGEETATQVPGQTPTPAPDIRMQDLTTAPALRSFLDSTQGVVDQTQVLYADLTADGVDEAIVDAFALFPSLEQLLDFASQVITKWSNRRKA